MAPLLVPGAVTGKPIKQPDSVISGDLSMKGCMGGVEGMTGSADLLPVPTDSVMPDNGAPPKSADFMPVRALNLFDKLPDRASYPIPTLDVTTAGGEIWERSPETVVMEGNTIRTFFPSLPVEQLQSLPGGGGRGLSAPSSANAGPVPRPGVEAELLDAPEGNGDGMCGMSSVPGSAGVAAGHPPAPCRAVLADSAAASSLFRRTAISHQGGMESDGKALWQPSVYDYQPGEDGLHGAAGSPSTDATKSAQIWTDCVQSGLARPDFAQVCNATVSRSSEGCARELRGMVEGQVDSTSTVVRPPEETSRGNAANASGANHFGPSAVAACWLAPASGSGSAWGSLPGSIQPGIAGGWSPDYREAFPSLRGDKEEAVQGRQSGDEGEARRAVAGDVPLSKLDDATDTDIETDDKGKDSMLEYFNFIDCQDNKQHD